LSNATCYKKLFDSALSAFEDDAGTVRLDVPLYNAILSDISDTITGLMERQS
jgi:hypothetical protein